MMARRKSDMSAARKIAMTLTLALIAALIGMLAAIDRARPETIEKCIQRGIS